MILIVEKYERFMKKVEAITKIVVIVDLAKPNQRVSPKKLAGSKIKPLN